MRNALIATMTAAATMFAVSTADAALVSVSSGPFDISALGGAQAYGVNLTSTSADDTFEADFLFTVVDGDAGGIGASAIENTLTADLTFTSIELLDSAGNALVPPVTGTITIGTLDFAEICCTAVTLLEGEDYIVRISGEFNSVGNAAIGGTVSLTPVPVPAALPLMVSAIAAVGLVGVRRKS